MKMLEMVHLRRTGKFVSIHTDAVHRPNSHTPIGRWGQTNESESFKVECFNKAMWITATGKLFPLPDIFLANACGWFFYSALIRLLNWSDKKHTKNNNTNNIRQSTSRRKKNILKYQIQKHARAALFSIPIKSTDLHYNRDHIMRLQTSLYVKQISK